MNQSTTLDAPSISGALRERTADAHHRAERHPLQQAIAKGNVGRPLFGRWVAEQRHLQVALERVMDAAAIADSRVGQVFAPHHRRVGRFDADCRSLGAELDRSPTAATATFVEALEQRGRQNPVALLGALYVIEGSTNGGQYLAAALRRSPAFADGSGLSALDPHGPATRELWQGFRTAIDSIALSSDERDAIVAMAADTFDAIGRMLDAVVAAQETA